MRLLPALIGAITRRPRATVKLGEDFEWSSDSWTHNIFRVWEIIAGRREGIRIEQVADSDGNVYSYTWENLFATYEGMLRAFFRNAIPKFKIVYVPQMQLAGLAQGGIQPFMFAIALDTSTISTEVNNTGQSWSHTCTGSNRILTVIDVAEGNSAGTDPYSNMTYGGTAMTVANKTADSANSRYCKGWYLVAPATGANTLQPTVSSQYNQGASASYSGASQGTIDNTAVAAATLANTSFTISITPVASNCWVFCGVSADQGTWSASGTATATIRKSGGAPMVIADSNGTVTGGASYTMTFTPTTVPSAHVGGVIMSIAPVPVAAPTNSNFFAFM